jgi:predicted nucleotidyltransferase
VSAIPLLISRTSSEYRRKLEAQLPGRVRRVTIFGSVARGEATEDSDVDVLVVVDAPSFAERQAAMNLASELGLENDLVLAPIVLSMDEWVNLERRERSLPREIARDGVEA